MSTAEKLREITIQANIEQQARFAASAAKRNISTLTPVAFLTEEKSAGELKILPVKQVTPLSESEKRENWSKLENMFTNRAKFGKSVLLLNYGSIMALIPINGMVLR